MADEITHNAPTGLTLYACRFQPNGDVFLTSGASDEVWGTGARDAVDYAVPLTEDDTGAGESRHYKGDFDTSGNITDENVYHVTAYRQLAGGGSGNEADTDPPIAQGDITWNGTGEITLITLQQDSRAIKNVYKRDEETAEGVFPESEL